MKIISELSAISTELRGTVLALGNFDGVHKGHQAVLGAAQDAAIKLGVPCGVMVFEPHPREFFNPSSPVFRITPIEAKLEVFKALGLDYCIVVPFNEEFSQQSAADFVAEDLVARLGVKHVVAGYDFHFGNKRQGNPEFLIQQGKIFGFETSIVAPLEMDSEPYSSSGIRVLLEAGNVAGAANNLGYRWFVRGQVVDGDKRGRELGFPTANMAMPESCRMQLGIYAVRMRRFGPDGMNIHDGVASYGVRPTFGGGKALLETFLFDFDEDIYGETVEVALVGFIRPEAKFDSVDALVEQMHKDSIEAKAILVEAAGKSTSLDQNLNARTRKL